MSQRAFMNAGSPSRFRRRDLATVSFATESTQIDLCQRRSVLSDTGQKVLRFHPSSAYYLQLLLP